MEVHERTKNPRIPEENPLAQNSYLLVKEWPTNKDRKWIIFSTIYGKTQNNNKTYKDEFTSEGKKVDFAAVYLDITKRRAYT